MVRDRTGIHARAMTTIDNPPRTPDLPRQHHHVRYGDAMSLILVAAFSLSIVHTV